jgi:mannosylglycoprotein endo-beta-mannosidase
MRGDSIKKKKELLNELEILEILEEDNILNGDQYARKGVIQATLMQIYEEEEAFWFERSSKKWLLEGDNNTAYFHRIANGRKGKNTMYSLKKDDVNIQGTTDLLEHALEYYKGLFGPGEGNNMALDANIWSVEEKLNEDDNEVLNEPFSESEIKNALDCMVKNKAQVLMEFLLNSISPVGKL